VKDTAVKAYFFFYDKFARKGLFLCLKIVGLILLENLSIINNMRGGEGHGIYI